ncbi:hypothetical protein NMK71_09955 [Weeksellaceae bacterium KMM 9713]|uniref:Uncharacterized protein n=1 Tax=Profundicola chukchiensis TaxID=2961959 RepID=A0A9X4RVJ4_9FLAO|nr:hypothetical protein [Profundicola chukchiensis]MDG4946741.1 hypothetical protein [Profundicola chukchiensis]
MRLSVTFFHYAVFNESFTEMYCENIDKPELECNGKCHLLQEIDDEHTDSHAFYLNKNLHENIWLYVVVVPNLLEHKQSFSFSNQPTVEPHNLYQFSFSDFIFHPPIA